MTYSLRLILMRLFASLRDVDRSEARCQCGRMYRLVFESPWVSLLESAEAGVQAEPESTRFDLLEVDKK